jgi:hypothetical protein
MGRLQTLHAFMSVDNTRHIFHMGGYKLKEEGTWRREWRKRDTLEEEEDAKDFHYQEAAAAVASVLLRVRVVPRG